MEREPAGDAVRGYLDALSRGDAAAALSYSTDQPASKDLLSDEILKKQIARWPISDVKILDDNSAHSFGFAQVHVVAKFGGNTSDVTMPIKKTGKDWKLDRAAIELDTINAGVGEDALKTVTVFGKTVTGSPAYIFPGWVDVSSSNPNLAVEPKKPYLLDALAFTGSTYLNDLDFSLSDSGQSATMSAISAALADCAKSNQLSPPNCPQHAYDPDLVDGTATWGTPDISGIKVTLFDPYHLGCVLGADQIRAARPYPVGWLEVGPGDRLCFREGRCQAEPAGGLAALTRQLAEQALG